MDLSKIKLNTKHDSKIKIAVLTILILAVSLFTWTVVKRSFYAMDVQFTISNIANFWQWFWLKVGWPLAGLLTLWSLFILYLIAVYNRWIVFFMGAMSSAVFLFVFYSSSQLAMICYLACAILLTGALVISDKAIQKEQTQRVNFAVKPLVRCGIGSLIFVLVLMLSSVYYFSPMSTAVDKLTVPDNLINQVIGTVNDIAGSQKEQTGKLQNLAKDYLSENMPGVEIDNDMLNNAIQNIPSVNLGSGDSSLFGDIKDQVNKQIDTIFSPYYKYLPIFFTVSFFLLLQFLGKIFSSMVILLASMFTKICFAFGIFEKETISVNKENIIF